MTDEKAPPRGSDDAGDAPPPVEFLPWHELPRARIATALAADRLPHGLVVRGPAGVGKEQFASALAAALLCTARGASFEACRSCADCRLSLAGNHPDVHWLRPAEDRKSIGVQQVRELIEEFALTSLRRGWRVALVSPAHVMTEEAQNALLKTLEEPPPRALLVLVTSRPSRLLPTLRSRCQNVVVARPEQAVALDWLGTALGREASPRLLEVAGGAPLKALGIAPHFEPLERQMIDVLEGWLGGRTDVTRAAEALQGEGLAARLDWIEGWLSSALQQRAGLAAATGLTFRAGSPLQRASAELNITAAFQVLDRLREARRLLESTSTAPNLVTETLLLDLRAALRPRR